MSFAGLLRILIHFNSLIEISQTYIIISTSQRIVHGKCLFAHFDALLEITHIQENGSLGKEIDIIVGSYRQRLICHGERRIELVFLRIILYQTREEEREFRIPLKTFLQGREIARSILLLFVSLSQIL